MTDIQNSSLRRSRQRQATTGRPGLVPGVNIGAYDFGFNAAPAAATSTTTVVPARTVDNTSGTTSGTHRDGERRIPPASANIYSDSPSWNDFMEQPVLSRLPFANAVYGWGNPAQRAWSIMRGLDPIGWAAGIVDAGAAGLAGYNMLSGASPEVRAAVAAGIPTRDLSVDSRAALLDAREAATHPWRYHFGRLANFLTGQTSPAEIAAGEREAEIQRLAEMTSRYNTPSTITAHFREKYPRMSVMDPTPAPLRENPPPESPIEGPYDVRSNPVGWTEGYGQVAPEPRFADLPGIPVGTVSTGSGIAGSISPGGWTSGYGEAGLSEDRFNDLGSGGGGNTGGGGGYGNEGVGGHGEPGPPR